MSIFPVALSDGCGNEPVHTGVLASLQWQLHVQVAVRGYRAPSSGLANFTVDGGNTTTVDTSDFYNQATLVYRSDSLPDAKHSLQIACLGKGGAQSDDASAVAIVGFWVLSL